MPEIAGVQYSGAMSVDRSVVWELSALGTATAAFLATFEVRPRYVDLLLAAAAVALIVFTTARSHRLWELARALEPEAGARAWRATFAFTGVALVVLATIAAIVARDAETPIVSRFANWHLLATAAIYFPWALLQQFIFQFYLFPRWLRLVPLPAAIALTAVAFAAVHFPRWPVMLVTLVAGTAWAFIYYRWRRLVPLALSHALLGTALHYWVFGNDLFARWSVSAKDLLERLLP
jgi:membrane protease YdiL (CAAX protease family)